MPSKLEQKGLTASTASIHDMAESGTKGGDYEQVKNIWERAHFRLTRVGGEIHANQTRRARRT